MEGMTDERKKRPRDTNQLAKAIVDLATGESEEDEEKKDPEAVRRGKQGAKARAKKLTADERSKIARNAAKARWENKDR